MQACRLTCAGRQPALTHARGDAPTTCVNARENAAALASPISSLTRLTGAPSRSSVCASATRQRSHPYVRDGLY